MHRNFDLSSLRIVDGPNVLIIGRRGTGKTHLVQKLVAHYREEEEDIDGFVFSPFPHCRDLAIVPPSAHFTNEYTTTHTEIADNIRTAIMERDAPRRASFVVFDNCFNDDVWHRGETVQNLFVDSARWKTTTLLTMSYPMTLSSAIRIDCVFVFAEPVVSVIRKVWFNYAQSIMPVDAFIELHANLTKHRYDCMVIDLRVVSAKPEERIFWYRA